MADIELQNSEVSGWAGETLQDIKAKYMGLVNSPSRSGEGLDSLRLGTKKHFGEIDVVTFRFNRYLVWLHKGASRGHGGSKGSTWYYRGYKRKRTNPASFGKMDTGNRSKEEWLNPVLNVQVPKLASVVAGFKADQAVKAIQIK